MQTFFIEKRTISNFIVDTLETHEKESFKNNLDLEKRFIILHTIFIFIWLFQIIVSTC